jgi:hypothetical protein
MARLKHEAVTSSWNTLVIQGAGKDKWVMDRVEKMIKDANMPGVTTVQQDVSSGMFGTRRKFLVVNHQNLRDYHMYIGARDYGSSLDVSWYLTIQPSAMKRAFSKYTTGNPQALSMQVDFFSQQDLSAYTGFAHHCVTEVVQELMKELEQDPTGLNTKSKGFLELW